MKSKDDDKEPEFLNYTKNKRSQLTKKHIRKFRQKGMSALSNMSKDEQTLFVSWAQEAVDQYGVLLQKNPAKIKNVADLPCSKEDLKIAIKALLPAYLEKGSDDVVSLLKDRYIRISAYQEIRQEDKDTIIKGSVEFDTKSDSRDTSLFSTYQKYMQIIVSEQKILLDEINVFIADLQIQKRDS